MALANNKITRATVKRLTDTRSWQRGVDYYDRGHVQSLLVDGDEVIAKVFGTAQYKVILQISGTHIDGDCNCPMGDDGYFCKHCVAASLAYLSGEGIEHAGRKKTSRKKAPKTITISDIRKHLNRKDKKALVSLLIEQIKDNDVLREKITFELTMGSKDGMTIDVLYALIDKACDSYGNYDFDFGYGHGYDCPDMSHCGEQAKKVVTEIDRFLKKNNSEEIVELIEYAIEKFQSAMAYDPYDDELYLIVEDLSEMHLKACKKVKPDPVKFAEHLFMLSLREGDAFYNPYDAYSPVLGKKGRERFQQILTEQWEKLPTVGKGQKETLTTARSRILSMMEDIVEESNDLDLLVAIKSKSLTHSWDYLEIAKLYRKHRKRDKSLEWVQKAVKVFGPKECRGDIPVFLAEEYCYQKKYAKAMEIIWSEFTGTCSLGEYKKLKRFADKCSQWKIWRPKAVDYMETAIQKEAGKRRRGWGFSVFGDRSLLVEIYLWENTPEKAWKEAQEGGCSRSLWLKLAKIREEKHPADTIKIYQAEVIRLVEQTDNDAYKEAIGYIKIIKKLMAKAKQVKQYQLYINQLHVEFKRKRNFIKMLAKV